LDLFLKYFIIPYQLFCIRTDFVPLTPIYAYAYTQMAQMWDTDCTNTDDTDVRHRWRRWRT